VPATAIENTREAQETDLVLVDVVSAISISRSCETVAAFAANPDNAPKWYANIRSVEWHTPRPLQVGSRVAFVAYFLGRRLSYVYQIAEYHPVSLLVMRTAHGPFPMETTYEWAPLGEGGTRMTLRNRGEPSGFSRFMIPIIVPAMKGANRKDLARLKGLLEAGV
jgi:hypothetical protein